MALKPVTVSQLNEYIGRVISTDPLLGIVIVKGEITSLKYHHTGHVYFSISDSRSKINCFLSMDIAEKMDFMLSDGDEVVITGAVKVFQKNGTYSLNVRQIETVGAGELAAEFEKLKKKLEKEGLFDKAHKKPIPEHPKHIGIITSPTGAGLMDILKIIGDRNNLIDITVFPVLVQGVKAADDIINMVDFVSEKYQNKIDTLIVGRGGGAPEELAVFNDEGIARALFRCNIPVISAVGHEIAFTIADFVSDARAETPTAAAQMVAPDMSDVKSEMEKAMNDLRAHMANKLMYNTIQTDHIRKEMLSSIKGKVALLKGEIERCKAVIEGADPSLILRNGYSLVKDFAGKAIGSAGELLDGGEYTLEFSDGSAKIKVLETRRNDCG